jgi:hypothetical protein
MGQGATGDNAKNVALMLILDVRTRWSSTHQMLCECLFYIMECLSDMNTEQVAHLIIAALLIRS